MKVPGGSRILAALAIAAVVLAATPLMSAAQAPVRATLELGAVSGAAIGDSIELRAVLTSDGTPVAGAEVVFLRSVEFMNTGNDLLIGRATTDDFGVASAVFRPRSEGDVLITVEFDGIDDVGSAWAEGNVFVGPGPVQYVEEAGIRVPGLNVWLLVAILSAVWGTFGAVIFLVWRIARDGSLTPVPADPVPEAGVQEEATRE